MMSGVGRLDRDDRHGRSVHVGSRRGARQGDIRHGAIVRHATGRPFRRSMTYSHAAGHRRLGYALTRSHRRGIGRNHRTGRVAGAPPCRRGPNRGPPRLTCRTSRNRPDDHAPSRRATMTGLSAPIEYRRSRAIDSCRRDRSGTRRLACGGGTWLMIVAARPAVRPPVGHRDGGDLLLGEPPATPRTPTPTGRSRSPTSTRRRSCSSSPRSRPCRGSCSWASGRRSCSSPSGS